MAVVVAVQDPHLPPPAFPMSPRELSIIDTLIIHHTAGPAGQTVAEIDQEHRNNGWAMIGYNFVIEQDGSQFNARPVDFVPAAAYGYNAKSVNIVLTGNFQSDDPGFTGPPSAAQIQSVKSLSLYVHHRYPSIIRTIGHRDVATLFYPTDTAPYATACPGDQLYSQLPSINAYVRSVLLKT